MKIKISKISFIVVLFMAFLTLVIGLFFHIKGYWNNYWTFWSSFSGAITAVIVFIWQSQYDRRNDAVSRYLEFQDDMFKDISNSLLQFDSSLRVENQSIEEKKELAQELVTLLYMMEEGKNRLSYVKHFQKASDEPDPRFGSFTDLDRRLRVVLADPKNEDLRDLIENNYPDLKRIISQKFAAQNAEDSILKHWYLSEKSARSAKYLIGVSAVDKRILGIYKIGGSKAIELEGVWVSFKYDEIEEILKPVSEKEKNKDNYVAEELKQWTGRNPILYLKEYFINSKGESILSSQTKEGLARQLKIEPKEFDQLGDREIIVVRTADLN